jgi:hypothetical protein
MREEGRRARRDGDSGEKHVVVEGSDLQLPPCCGRVGLDGVRLAAGAEQQPVRRARALRPGSAPLGRADAVKQGVGVVFLDDGVDLELQV